MAKEIVLSMHFKFFMDLVFNFRQDISKFCKYFVAKRIPPLAHSTIQRGPLTWGTRDRLEKYS
jgi:hypothetical protein